MLLKDKAGIIFGVANKRSIAYACALAASEQGAKLILTYQGDRLAEKVGELAESLPGEAIALPLDVEHDGGINAAFEQIAAHMPVVNFGVHSIAYALREELDGEFLDTSREGYRVAHLVSSWSLTGLARRMTPLMTEGGSIVTMSYMGAEKVVPHYNVMGPAKASLEASVRYLAYDLGPRDIRVNAISPGPIRTLAASGIAGFSKILEFVKERSPLRRNTEPSEVADAVIFLLSDMSKGITGTTLHVDSGFNITVM
ncbi:MAG: enoyl-ACP reductase [Planctomycetota bacterium]|nr:enoyl-ACP reductase [Planctomycetota bacterium]